MNKIFSLIVVVTLISFIEVRQTNTFNELHALTGGTWVMKTKKGFLCERWEKKNNHTISNQAFQITGVDTTKLEQVDIVEKNNEINYISTVANENEGKPITFKLTGSKDGQYVFSNPEHDFPQRIIYQFMSKDSLHAWIDGTYKGKESRKDFYYSRER